MTGQTLSEGKMTVHFSEKKDHRKQIFREE